MKKGLFFSALLFCASAFAQQYVHQVLVANEGFFDFQTNNIIEPATIGTLTHKPKVIRLSIP